MKFIRNINIETNYLFGMNASPQLVQPAKPSTQKFENQAEFSRKNSKRLALPS
jgi:hypothetical protein